MKNTNQMYLSAQEVANILGMSKSYAYTVIKKMNEELEKRDCITIPGKIPTKYFEEKFFGVQVIQ
ncbi:helix-turn-helix domain-containing protein [Candidatus Galacturonibacter soehngenii]|uniref:Helix-turn-helix domain-containing protein n=1 Tax=Candidatus Galacturonatibacter soehngenii TaxID=2307010 RepID=A0A7V7QKU6_9FIRM|nr:helix-turn-helix domain-containing protein [Candidatus Galacturonibacter soehngenii]KAB1438507.1 helix-turn-helix domain-containing protein [Candidatus Galacturonibacter soehngenii]